MVFQEIRKKLPFQLAFKKTTASSSYEDLYNAYDIALGGIPFLYKIDAQNPLTRSTAQFRKQQLDTSREPGEQSLSGWWLRSQASFHLGAGIRYGDPELDESAPYRFRESEGVDVWTPGQVTLLPSTELLKSATGTIRMITATDNGTEKYYRVEGADLYQGTADGVETMVLDGTQAILDITTDGSDVYVATTSAVTKIPNGSGVADPMWTLTSAASVTLGWVKQRMVLGVDNAIYVPTFDSDTLPTAVYEHPNESWVWTDIVEGPEAIYISGGVGAESVIIRLALDNTGAVPTLTAATVVAAFPSGEQVTCMHSYLGTYLGIGTNKGFRVAQISDGGGLQYGPLIETESPVRAVAARGNHFLVGYANAFSDGTSGLMRVELRNQLASGAFPYATDLQVHSSGQVDSIAILSTSDLALIGVTDAGLYKEEASTLEEQGYLITARQRFNTVWPKLFKRFNVRGTFAGPMTVSTIDSNESEISIISVSVNTDQSTDLAINYPDTPQEFLSLKFTLHRNPNDDTEGTIFRSYQLKSLPGGPRPRQFTLPLLCMDFERDRFEHEHGHVGYALERLEGIEAFDSSGDAVLFQDLVTGEGYLVTIEAMEFRQIDPPSSGDSRWGGVLTVALRTLSA
jgi:hypothetical protein